MNIAQVTKYFLLCLVTAIPPCVQAIIIDGSFTGKVLSVSDNGDNNNPYFVDFFSSDLEGTDFSGSFWYDTDLAPANLATEGQWRYSENNNWFGVTFYVDGKTLNPVNIPEGSIPFSSLELHNIASPLYSTGIHDFTEEYFGIRESVVATKEGYLSEQSAGITFLDSIMPLLDGNSLIQDFTWYDTYEVYENWDDIPGLALYFNYNSDPEQLVYAGLAARLSEITVKPREVNVPEPPTVLLLGLGVLMLFMRRKKIN